jgi:DNA polymerase-3 subunit gamma/tau
MALIRLCFAANLPTPAEALRALGDAADGPVANAGSSPRPAPRPTTPIAGSEATGATGPRAASPSTPRPAAPSAPVARMAASNAAPALEATAGQAPRPAPTNFTEVVALFEQRREQVLAHQLGRDVHPVRCEPGRLEFRPTATAQRDLAPRVADLLSQWTGRRWMVSVSGDAGEPTLAQQRAVAEDAQRAQALAHPLVQAALATFPGATLEAVRVKDETAAAASPMADVDAAGGEDMPDPEAYPTDAFEEIPERDD